MKAATAVSRLVRSPAMAIGVLLSLAVLAALGTVTPPPLVSDPPPEVPGWQNAAARLVGLRRTFSSPLFLSLVALSVVNLVACTWHRLAARLRARSAGLTAATDALLHGSLVVLVAGGVLKVLFGFLGTQNIHVGDVSPTIYDWKAGRDASPGFAIGIDDFQTGYYPVRARIGVRRADTGEKVALVEVVEGAALAVADGDLILSVDGYDPSGEVLRLGVSAGGATQVLAFATGGASPAARVGAYELSLVAYRADLKSAHAVVSLYGPGSSVRGARLGPGDTIVHRGHRLFLTAWGTDPEGRRYCGIQVARDPGAPVFWAGCVLLVLAIPLHIMAKGRRKPPSPSPVTTCPPAAAPGTLQSRSAPSPRARS